MPKKSKKLKREDCDSIIGPFVDDLVAYRKAGGSLKNLTAKKVYAKLRGSDEKVYDYDDLLADIEKTKAEIKVTFGDYPYIDDGKVSYEDVDIMFDFDLTDDDHNYLMDKLNFGGDAAALTKEQQEVYALEAMKLRGIREEDAYLYLKVVYHNTNEEVDFELFKDKDESGDSKK